VTGRRGCWVSERERRDSKAVHCLVAAAEAMLFPDSDARAAALLYTCRALMLITEGDPDEIAREKAEGVVRNLIAEREPRP
jgi:hypothetical protein